MKKVTTWTEVKWLPVLLFVVVIGAHAQPVTDGGAAYDGWPRYVRFVSDSVDVRRVLENDSLFYALSRGVVFTVNRWDLKENDPFVRELCDRVLPGLRGWQLVGVGLRGAASPEGPYRWNVTLSERRAGTIMELLGAGGGVGDNAGSVGDNVGLGKQECLPSMGGAGSGVDSGAGSGAGSDAGSDEAGTLRPPGYSPGRSPEGTLGRSPRPPGVTTQTVAEDYVHLVLMMREAGDRDVGVVRDIVERYGGDLWRLKVELQRVDSGRLWKRLLKEYFPDLRMARLVLFYKPKGEDMASVPTSTPATVPSMAMQPLPDLEPFFYTRERERRHMLSVGTNLLYDAFWMPGYGWAPMVNVELEFYPRRGRWTYLAAFTFPYYHKWSQCEFFQIRDYHLELRRYFRPGLRHTGWFVGAYGNVNKYGIGLSDTKGWQGEGGGGALKAGYVWALGRKGCWRLEASAALGGYVTRYDPYVYGNPVTGTNDGWYYYDYTGEAKDFQRRNYRRVWMGPTEVGIKLRWDVLYWRRKGVRP